MKILYGVQGTGNGHISRARSMQKELAKRNIEVDWLFSGRPEDQYFDMEKFTNCEYKKGLTFHVDNGRVKYFRTALELNLKQFFKDVKSINCNDYDLILTDFEPITAWAGKKAKIPVYGLGHQYVFNFAIPQKRADIFSRIVLNQFAPVKKSFALHWHHFEQNILPPIVDTHEQIQTSIDDKKVVVYLPFENQEEVLKCLSPIRRYDFKVYSPNPITSGDSNVEFKPLSREGFLKDLHSCDAVIANAGFELSSEVISLGKRLLVKPLTGQVEQHSNAIALKKLQYGNVMHRLNSGEINRFLKLSNSVQVNYPNVAEYIADWIESGMPKRDDEWFKQIWDGVKVTKGYSGSQSDLSTPQNYVFKSS